MNERTNNEGTNQSGHMNKQEKGKKFLERIIVDLKKRKVKISKNYRNLTELSGD